MKTKCKMAQLQAQNVALLTPIYCKSKLFENLTEVELCVTKECGNPIATLRTDNGGEYLLNEF